MSLQLAFVYAQDWAVTTMSCEEAVAREFVAYIQNNAKKVRVEELCWQLKVGPFQNKTIYDKVNVVETTGFFINPWN